MLPNYKSKIRLVEVLGDISGPEILLYDMLMNFEWEDESLIKYLYRILCGKNSS